VGKPQQETLFGHPVGLYTLFFAEMWERFSYYGMRALLVLYMIKGFLQYSDGDAYKIYGAYTALVYMTPFFGGMLADRLLGARRCVVLGALLMAAGHLTMTFEQKWVFYLALALLVVGNGFFKPNISTIVGTLYGQGDPRRDGGFTIFYMGINLGAAMAPLLCGYVGERFGWHYGFGLATAGMLTGLAVFVVPNMLARLLILAGALGTAGAMVVIPYRQDNMVLLVINLFVALALVASGVISYVALGKGGIPDESGRPPNMAKLKERVGGLVSREWLVYLGTAASVPVILLLIASNRSVTLIGSGVFDALASWGMIGSLAANVLEQVSTPASLILSITGLAAFVYLLISAINSTKIVRDRLFVVLTLMFFSLLFWAFFEQAGSSINNFTDRNVDRVFGTTTVSESDVGKTIEFELNQEQLGYAEKDEPVNLTVLTKALDEGREKVQWQVTKSHVGMQVGGSEIPASTFQSANPIFILLFGLVFTALWVAMARARVEPSTPCKFALGLLQLGLGFAVLWYGAKNCDARGMVSVHWLLLAYLLHTTGELCLSPVGLSMVTRLSPARLVSTVMGAWFLATAFSNLAAGIIATFTGVGQGGEGEQIIPIPNDTVNVYGHVFGLIALMAIGSAVLCFLLVPLLKYWMHEGEEVEKE
jgi:POT family proton-dependent oligopeptide transporter